MSVAQILGQDLGKQLYAKDVQTRKEAGGTLELWVRNSIIQSNGSTVVARRLAAAFESEFLKSSDPYKRKGGLLAFASIALGLEGEIRAPQNRELLRFLVTPVVTVLEEGEDASQSKVKFFAIESLYNILKSAGEAALDLWPTIFRGLSARCPDSDFEMRRVLTVVDRLMKDIVASAGVLEPRQCDEFMAVYATQAQAKNPGCREFVLSWGVLMMKDHAVELVKRLPSILSPLLVYLSDPNADVRHNADALLGSLLQGLKKTPVGQRAGIISGTVDSLLFLLSNPKDPQHPLHSLKDNPTALACVRLTALCWLDECLRLMAEEGPALLSEDLWVPRLQGIVTETLRSMNDPEEVIRRIAVEMNNALLVFVPALKGELPVRKILDQLLAALRHPHSSTDVRTFGLQWICMLLDRCPEQMFENVESIFEPLSETLKHEDDEVVAATLCVLAQIMRGCPPTERGGRDPFRVVIERLLVLFQEQSGVLQKKGRLIIRYLCGHVDPRRLYVTAARSISKVSEERTNAEFAQQLVQIFNWILLTAPETKDLREELLLTPPLETLAGPRAEAPAEAPPRGRGGGGDHRPQPSGAGGAGRDPVALFMELLEPWFFNPVSTLALCLWSQQYEFASELTERFAAFEPTLELLKQLDQLVHLLESPVSSRLRLRLLEPQRYPALLKCLLGLAMLLPQAGAFNILRERLHVIQSGLLLEAQQARLDHGREGSKAGRDGMLSWTSWRGSGQAAGAADADKVKLLLDRFDEVTALSMQ